VHPEDPGPEPTETSALQARVADLTRALEAARAENDRLVESEWRLRHFFEITHETVAVVERGVIVDVNEQFEDMLGWSREEAIGQSPLKFTAPEAHELTLRHISLGSEEPYETVMLRRDGTTFAARVRARMLERDGRKIRITALIDITAQKQAEEVLRQTAVREETLRIQNDVIARIGAPLLPISENALVLPLVAQVNEDRAAQVMESLTNGVVTHRVAYAILDVTGVEALDAPAIELLVSAARAVELLGAQMIITGIRPELALRLVDCDLGRIKTFATLRQGVAHALRDRS
jgi:rsbT co-antagonist protein RsbR